MEPDMGTIRAESEGMVGNTITIEEPWQFEQFLRPSVICNSKTDSVFRPAVVPSNSKERKLGSGLLNQRNSKDIGMSVRVNCDLDGISQPRSSLFHSRDWKDNDPRQLAGPSRLSSSDYQDVERLCDNQSLTSYLVVHPSCNDEYNHVTLSAADLEHTGKEKYKTVILRYPGKRYHDTAIKKTVLCHSSCQSLESNTYYMPYEENNSEFYQRLPLNVVNQKGHNLPQRETRESEDDQEKGIGIEEREEKISDVVHEESLKGKYNYNSTYFGEAKRSGSFVEQYECRKDANGGNKRRDEIQEYRSIVPHGSVSGSERAKYSKITSFPQNDVMQSRQHDLLITLPKYQNQNRQVSFSNIQDYKFKVDNLKYLESERQKRVEHLSEHWTERHKEGIKCLVCFKILKKNNYIKSHMLIHTGDKPYSCAYCSKTFNQVGNRNVHQRIHTGEKPYACDYCDKRFVFNSSKRSHMKSHCS